MKVLNKPFLTLALAACSLPLLAEMQGFINMTPHTWYLTPDVPPRSEHATGARSVINVAVGSKGGPSGKKYTSVNLRSKEATRQPIEVPTGARVNLMPGKGPMDEDYPVNFKLWLLGDPGQGAVATNVISIATVTVSREVSETNKKVLNEFTSEFKSDGLAPERPIELMMSMDRKSKHNVSVAFDEGFREDGYCFVKDKEEGWLWDLVEGKDHSSESTSSPSGKLDKPAGGKCVVQ